MPLTFAHPAAVLPLGRRLPLAALVVGSMAPDLVYFLLLARGERFGHTLPGLFVFCIPAGLALLWSVDHVLRRPMLALGPDGLRARLPATPPARPLGVTVFAIWIAAVTHAVWDAFTHGGTWATALVPALERVVGIDRGGDPVTAFEVAQHISTALGLLVVTTALVRWWRRTPPHPVPHGLSVGERVKRLVLLGGIAAVPAVWSGIVRSTRSAVIEDFFASAVVVGVAVAFWLSVAYSLAVRHRARRGA